MFNERGKNSMPIETLIGEGCCINGSLNGEGLIQICGMIKGDIFWQDEVIIAPKCCCSGNITCKSARVSGMVEGNVICDNTLTIESKGRIKGDITVKNLHIEEGGTFDGKCTMMINKSSSDIME